MRDTTGFDELVDTGLARAVTRDAYVLLNPFAPGVDGDQQDIFEYDRIHVRVNTLEQADDARTILRDLLNKRHRGVMFQVR